MGSLALDDHFQGVDSARLTSAERKSDGMQIDLIWVRLPRPS